jgi:hypothetical protein
MCLKVQALPSRWFWRGNQVHYATAGQSDCSDDQVCSDVAGIKESYGQNWYCEISKRFRPWLKRNCQWIQQRAAVLMSEFMFKFLLSTVNTFISHKMCVLPISTQRYNKQCSSNEWVGKCIYRLGLLLLLAAWVFFNIKEYFTFSVHRSSNINLCVRQK